jgi:hypothetical protein
MVNDRHAVQEHKLSPRRAARRLTRALLLAVGLSCAACGNSPALTPLTARELAESGTAAFDAPRRTVLDACALALRKQGYAIDIADPDTGLVVTLRSPSEHRSPSGARMFRAYILEVKQPRSGRVEVVAWPAVSGGPSGRAPAAARFPVTLSVQVT